MEVVVVVEEEAEEVVAVDPHPQQQEDTLKTWLKMPASEARSPPEMWTLVPTTPCSWTLQRWKECQMKNVRNYWQLANALAARTLDTDTDSVQKGPCAQARIGEET